jgi:hypothetical protein
MSGMTVIMKIAERCNLNCPYCYMYTGPDQSWQKRPRFISDLHTRLLVDRLCEHLAAVRIRLLTSTSTVGSRCCLGDAAGAHFYPTLLSVFLQGGSEWRSKPMEYCSIRRGSISLRSSESIGVLAPTDHRPCTIDSGCSTMVDHLRIWLNRLFGCPSDKSTPASSRVC